MSLRGRCFALLITASAGMTGCVVAPPPPPIAYNDGYLHITQRSGTFACEGRPISVDSEHADVSLVNRCTRVRLAGAHVDLTVYVEPRGVIEITGEHNDVVWRQVRPGPHPELLDRGPSNSFHRNSRAPWEQDHDWWQEQH